MPFSLRKLKRAYSAWQNGLEGKGWNMLYIENHDHPRMVSRYGSEKYRVESAKMLAASYLFLKGTPFIYQGQEIGMTNWYPSDPSMYEDVQTRWQYENVKTKKSDEVRLKRLWHGSRDSARTPVQWSNSEYAGFSTHKPWFYVNENYKEVNVESQENDENSVLNFYRKAIKLRKELSAVRYGDYKEYNKQSKRVYTYSREDNKQKILVVCSFSENETEFKIPANFDLNAAKIILSNYDNESLILKPYETRVYLWNK
jgi:oligo-1,6-glucosidase